MTAIHGKNTYIEFDNAAGTPVPLSTYFKQVTAAKSFETADTSTFGQSAKTFIMGMNDETVDITGVFDIALNTHMTALLAALDSGTLATCTVTVGPAGNATGKLKTSRECLVKAYNWVAQTSSEITVTINFQRTGPNSDTVF
jgi:hypothetical protein